MPPAAANAAKDGKKGTEIKKAKAKSFKLNLHILEVKDIKMPKGADGKPIPPDLVVTASVGSFGTKYTQVQKQATSAIFDHKMDWKFMMAHEDFDKAKLKIRVCNANTDAKSESLGMYDIELKAIRRQPLGEYFMVWLALYQDPDEYVTELSGAIRCTISCLGGSQEEATHTEEEVQEAQEDESPMVLMPHLVRWTHYSLFVAVYRVEGLPNMDDYGSTDAFVSIKLPGQAASKTRVMRNSLNPTFNELLRLPVRMPMINDTVTIAVSDFDQGGYDDLVADTSFTLRQIINRGRTEPHWICLYGIKGREGLQDLRERLPHVPLDTCYKGRLLVGLIAEEVPTKLAPNNKSIGPCTDPKSEPFVIRFDLYQASQLDPNSAEEKSQITVELQVGGITLESDTTIVEGGEVRWDQMFPEKHINLPSDLAQCPDIFINVNYTTTTSETAERLGYIRLDLEDVVGFNHAPEWGTLQRDPLYPKVAAVPGFLQYRLDFGKQQNMPHSERERIVPHSSSSLRKYELRGHIYQARNLPAMDDDGLCDPYVIVSTQGYAGQTTVKKPTCNPIWYETIRLEVRLPQPIPLSAEILIRVYDKDDGEGQSMGGDQLIGNTTLKLLGGNVNEIMPERPTWMPIWYEREDNTRGEILCSFQLVDEARVDKVPLDTITPMMRSVEVEVNVVGVRDLLSYNNAPISKPFVEIDCGDRETSDRYKLTHTSSRPTGSDANFLETLVINTHLPEDPLFCPHLNVRVFDDRGQHIVDNKTVNNQPVIAKCSIDLAPFCEWTQTTYVQNNRPRIPAIQIVEAIDELSDDEEEDYDARYTKYRSTIDHNLLDSNFGFMPEMRINTPSVSDLKEVKKFNTGRLKSKGVRTLPFTSAIVPLYLTECDADESARNEQPLEHELEHEIVDPPFDEWELYRGSGFGGSAKREVGKFKARVRVVEADLKAKAGESVNLVDLFEQSVYISRLYVTKGIKLTSRDKDGLADPFLVIRNGKSAQNVKDDVENFQKDTLNPNFYRCFELPTLVPGNPTLTIEVWDKDLHGRQLIGSTTIDIENRLFSEEWLKKSPKPVERRYLWSPASLAPQGKLEMWLEMLTPAQALAVKAKPLKPPMQIECQLRVVVFSVVELEYLGKSAAIEKDNSADVFVTVQAGNGPTYETDIHQGAKSTADFNWRFVFEVEQPSRNTKLNIQIWDSRSTQANDSLAECVLQLNTLYANVRKAHRVHEVPRQFYKCHHPLYPGVQAKIELGIMMMTRDLAELSENLAAPGNYRNAPNQKPILQPPNRSAGKSNRVGSQGGQMASALAETTMSVAKRIAGTTSRFSFMSSVRSEGDTAGNGRGPWTEGHPHTHPHPHPHTHPHTHPHSHPHPYPHTRTPAHPHTRLSTLLPSQYPHTFTPSMPHFTIARQDIRPQLCLGAPCPRRALTSFTTPLAGSHATHSVVQHSAQCSYTHTYGAAT